MTLERAKRIVDDVQRKHLHKPEAVTAAGENRYRVTFLWMLETPEKVTRWYCEEGARVTGVARDGENGVLWFEIRPSATAWIDIEKRRLVHLDQTYTQIALDDLKPFTGGAVVPRLDCLFRWAGYTRVHFSRNALILSRR
jgi:hypothetical protein